MTSSFPFLNAMALAGLSLTFPALDRLERQDQWRAWKTDVENRLRTHEFDTHLTHELQENADPEQRKAESFVKAYIYAHCALNVQMNVLDNTSAKQTWEKLHEIFDKDNGNINKHKKSPQKSGTNDPDSSSPPFSYLLSLEAQHTVSIYHRLSLAQFIGNDVHAYLRAYQETIALCDQYYQAPPPALAVTKLLVDLEDEPDLRHVVALKFGDWRATGVVPDLYKLIAELEARKWEAEESRTKKGKKDLADDGEKNGGLAGVCSHCWEPGHVVEGCYYLHPGKRPFGWMPRNRDIYCEDALAQIFGASKGLFEGLWACERRDGWAFPKGKALLLTGMISESEVRSVLSPQVIERAG